MDLEKLLKPEVQQWIDCHRTEDLHSLAFQKSPFENIKIQELIQQIQARKIAQKKFPKLNQNGILFPPKLNLEQTSSETTAQYKSNLVRGNVLVDLTGGFGIDSISFAEKFIKVYHVEKNESLQKMASHNFDVLELNNIHSFHRDGLEFVQNFEQKIDVIYLDPSRRTDTKKRVFLLEDLSPNVIEIIDEIQQYSKQILIKLSPLIDIDYLLTSLDKIAEIHIIAWKNEVKEVLVLISNEQKNVTKIKAINLESNHEELSFNVEDKHNISLNFKEIQTYLYQPNAAIIKADGNDYLAAKFRLKKLHPNTQLYTSDAYYQNFPGRVFEVGEPIKNPKKELKNKSIMAIHKNFPESLNNLRKKYKFSTDGISPILFTRNLERNLIQALKVKKL